MKPLIQYQGLGPEYWLGIAAIVLFGSLFIISQFTTITVNSQTGGLIQLSPIPSASTEDVQQQIHELINQERGKAGLPYFNLNSRLTQLATYHSNDMAAKDDIFHSVPFACTMPSLVQRGGQNVALMEDWSTGTEIAKMTVDGWMNSAGHRKAILEKVYQHEGIGVTISGRTAYITANFC